jgi:hypothetical protein
MSRAKFIEACHEGDALLEEIEDYIDEWHDSDSEEEIYEYLGMTIDEYGLWVENDAMLKTIIYSRELGIPVMDFIKNTSGEKLVARSSSPEEAASVKEWLVRKGFLKN